MLILSTESAVNTFKSRAQISVGAELGVSVGPIGRSIESDVTAGNKVISIPYFFFPWRLQMLLRVRRTLSAMRSPRFFV